MMIITYLLMIKYLFINQAVTIWLLLWCLNRSVRGYKFTKHNCFQTHYVAPLATVKEHRQRRKVAAHFSPSSTQRRLAAHPSTSGVETTPGQLSP